MRCLRSPCRSMSVFQGTGSGTSLYICGWVGVAGMHGETSARIIRAVDARRSAAAAATAARCKLWLQTSSSSCPCRPPHLHCVVHVQQVVVRDAQPLQGRSDTVHARSASTSVRAAACHARKCTAAPPASRQVRSCPRGQHTAHGCTAVHSFHPCTCSSSCVTNEKPSRCHVALVRASSAAAVARTAARTV